MLRINYFESLNGFDGISMSSKEASSPIKVRGHSRHNYSTFLEGKQAKYRIFFSPPAALPPGHLGSREEATPLTADVFLVNRATMHVLGAHDVHKENDTRWRTTRVIRSKTEDRVERSMTTDSFLRFNNTVLLL